MELEKVVVHNRAVIARTESLNVRAGKTVFTTLSHDEMVTRFTTSLRGARRASEIQDFDALRLPELDPAAVQAVLDDNPDTVEILGCKFPVEYCRHCDPTIEISFNGDWANRWKDLCGTLSLPSGRNVSVESTVEGYEYCIDAVNPVELKDKIRNALNSVQWGKWNDKPEMETVDPEDSKSEIPFVTAVYGQCVVTGEDLLAYGTLKAHQQWSGSIEWRPVWCQFESEAEEVFVRTVEKLKEIKAAIAKKCAEAAQAKAEAEVEAEAERLKQEHEEQLRLGEELRKRQAEEHRLEAVARGKERVANLNQRRKVLGWEALPVYDDGFEFDKSFVSFDDEKGLQAAETVVAREEQRQEDLKNREVNSADLTALLAHFNK